MTQTWTVEAVLKWTADYFKKNSMPEPRLEAEVLLAWVLCCDRLSLFVKNEQVLSTSQLDMFRSCITQRKLRKPISYITGEREFMGLSFKVNQHTLIPRPETELLVEKAVSIINEKNAKIVADICTGTGNIAVSVAKLSNVEKVFAADLSVSALSICWKNASAHGVNSKVMPKQGNMLCALEGEGCQEGVDVILSNPPYITEDEFALLEPELRFEPKMALYGGQDGLDYYRQLAQQARKYLIKKGHIIIELNANKSEDICEVFKKQGYKIESVMKDYAGLDRVAVISQ